jgi:hypothetical protein
MNMLERRDSFICESEIGIDLLDQYISPFPGELMEKQPTYPNGLAVHLLDLCQIGELLRI